MDKLELVSPAGSFDQLKAAANAGADAVYLAYEKYGARAYAGNFNLNKLEKAVLFSHSKNLKVYLALNTLIKEKELEDFLDFIFSSFKKINFNGIIIQDLAAGRIISGIFPDIPIHASTQLNLHNLYSVKLLKAAGFKRVILSREMTLSEIKKITSENIMDIEIFGHGSQCYSYSGQCYFSSFVGERSGNRGRCPQPCRMKYKLLRETRGNNNNKLRKSVSGDKGNEIMADCYFLSKNDLNLLFYLPEIIKSGVKALKLEGRMKTPEYVGIVTKIYRKYIDLFYDNPDKYFIEKDDIYKLKQIFSRELSEGYLKEEFPENIVSLKKSGSVGNYFGRVCKIKLREHPEIKIKDICIKSDFKLNKNDILEFWTKKGNERIKIENFEVADINSLKKIYEIQINNKINLNLNDRVFKYFDSNLDLEAKSLYLQDQEIIIAEEPKFNRIFNIDNYHKLKTSLKKRNLKALPGNTDIPLKIPSISLIICSENEKSKEILKNTSNIINANKIKYGKNFPGIKICYDDLNNILIKKDKKEFDELIEIIYKYEKENNDFYLVTPNIIYDNQMYELEKVLKKFLSSGFKNFYISNIGVLHLLNKICNSGNPTVNIVLGYNLNIFNSLAINEINDCLNKNIKITEIVLSPELTLEESNEIILNIRRNKINKNIFHDMDFSIFAYGFFPVMTSRVKYGEMLDLEKDSFNYYIKDLKNFRFKIGRDYLGNTILFNSRKHCLFFDVKEIIENHINGFLIDCRNIEDEEIYFTFKSFMEALALVKNINDMKLSGKKEIEKYENKYKELILKMGNSDYMKNYTKGHLFRSIL
ncbi:U32 family peptidase [bacterium]|nr:U32 family peptidase [bacterium]